MAINLKKSNSNGGSKRSSKEYDLDQADKYGVYTAFLSHKKKVSTKSGEQYEYFEGYLNISKTSALKFYSFGETETDKFKIEMTSLDAKSGYPKGIIWLTKRYRKSKDGSDYAIYTGSYDMANGDVMYFKTFGAYQSEKNDKVYMNLEIKQFTPNRI